MVGDYPYVVVALKNNSEYELHPALDIHYYWIREKLEELRGTSGVWKKMVFTYPKSEEILHNATFKNVTVVEMKTSTGVNGGKFGYHVLKQYVIIEDETMEVGGIVVLYGRIPQRVD